MNALRKRFAPPEYALLGQVASGTGSHAGRTADAIAMSLWPSRGLELIGFEIKVSRSDWLRELKDPAKADGFVRRCDRWYIAVSDAAIVAPGELPRTWGLIVVRNGVAKIETQAPLLEAKPLDRPFLAALLRRAQEQCVATEDLARARAEGYEAGHAAGTANSNSRVSTLERELEHLRKDIEEFEAASGVQIRRWRGQEIGEAVRLVLDGQLVGKMRTMRRFREDVAKLHDLMQQLPSLAPEPEEVARG